MNTRSSTAKLKLLPYALQAIALASFLTLAACGGGGDAADPAATDTDPGAETQLPAPPALPTPTPDLTFFPTEVELEPGQQTTVQVTISTTADLTGARFELPGVQDGVNGAFEAAADGHTGTLTLTASEAAEASDRPIMVLGASAVDGSKAWVGALRVTTKAALTAKTLFVNASAGNDAADGSTGRPFKTMGKAMGVATSGDTVKLLPGIYGAIGSSSSGDVFPVTVPVGVTLVGTLAPNGAMQSFLSTGGGTLDDLALKFAGDATIKDLEIDVFDTAILATKGTHSLTNLNLIQNKAGLVVTGTAKTTVTDSDFFMGFDVGTLAADVSADASFTMIRGTVEVAGQNCARGVSGVHGEGNAKVTLQNASFKNIAGSTVSLVGNSKATLGLQTTRILPLDCFPSPSIRINSPLTVITPGSSIQTAGGTQSVGIMNDGTGLLTIDSASIDGGEISGGTNSTAINVGPNSKFVMTRTHVLGAHTGVEAVFNKQGVTVIDSHFGLTHLAIEATTSLKVRGTTFSNYDRAIEFFGSDASGDLGTASDPGLNVFAQPRQPDESAVASVNLRFASSGFVTAAGNKWNAATQGSDINGNYPHKLEVGKTPSQFDSKRKNFFLPNANTRIQF